MTAPTYPRIDREIAEHGAHIMGYLDALPMEMRLAVWANVMGQMWQPIETAPKTNRARLVWVPEVRCTFCVTWRGDETQGEWGVFGAGYNTTITGATHWMPTPTPPKEQSDEADA